MGHSRQSGHANTVSLRNFVQSRFNRYVKLARLKPTYHRSQNAAARKCVIWCHKWHSCSKSNARPATNRRNAMRHAEANAEWGALDFEQECHLWHHFGHGAFTAEWSCKHLYCINLTVLRCDEGSFNNCYTYVFSKRGSSKGLSKRNMEIHSIYEYADFHVTMWCP